MGCDIHFHVELRQPDGTWQRAEAMVRDRYAIEGDPEMVRDQWFHGRNYTLFAILADVRNNGDVKPIEPPRDLPADVSDEVRAESGEWGIDGHSHSFFTIGELLAFDWRQETRHSGLVDDVHPTIHNGRFAEGGFAEAAQEYANTFHKFPWHWGDVSYCQGVSGPNADRYKHITWTEPYWTSAGSEWLACLLRMARLAGDDLTSVRAVFWFDN